jgi:hypothetical protein
MTVEGGYHTRCSSPTGPRRLSASLSPCRSAGNKRSMSPGGRRGSGRGNGSSEARPPDCVARLALYKRALQGKAHGGLYTRRRSDVGPILRASAPAKVTLFTLQRPTYYELFDLRCGARGAPVTLPFPSHTLCPGGAMPPVHIELMGGA